MKITWQNRESGVFNLASQSHLDVTLGKLLNTSFGLSCLVYKVWKCHNTTNLREFLWELNEYLIYMLIYLQCLTHNSYSIEKKCNFIENTVGETFANGFGKQQVGKFPLGCAPGRRKCECGSKTTVSGDGFPPFWINQWTHLFLLPLESE